MRTKARRDKNEPAIIEEFMRLGCDKVAKINDPGLPDLLIEFFGVIFLVEVKSKYGKLTEAQELWHELWHGSQLYVCRNVSECEIILNTVCETALEDTASLRMFLHGADDPLFVPNAKSKPNFTTRVNLTLTRKPSPETPLKLITEEKGNEKQ